MRSFALRGDVQHSARQRCRSRDAYSVIHVPICKEAAIRLRTAHALPLLCILHLISLAGQGSWDEGMLVLYHRT